MMDEHQRARRTLLKRGACALAAIPVIAWQRQAVAGKAEKSAFHYQDQPNDGHLCAQCVEFLPPADGTASGGCRIVEGPISPRGWCMAFTSK